MKRVRQYVAMATTALMIASVVPSSITYADSTTNMDMETNEIVEDENSEIGYNSFSLEDIDDNDSEISEEPIEEINSNDTDIEISNISQNSAYVQVNNAASDFDHIVISYVAKNNPDDNGMKILKETTGETIDGLKADTEYEVTVNQINLNMSSNGHMASPTSICLGKVSFKTLAGSGDFLILVGESLYENSELKESLDVYEQDLINEGIHPEIIRISKTEGTLDGADGVYNCKGHTEVKAVIKSRYDKGAKGFVIIGSGEDIPSAFVEVSADSEDTFPSDVYFADMDEDWIDEDNDGLYEQKFDGDKYYDYKPEMYYGRISAAAIAGFGRKTEAEYIKLYLDRVHNYRINGSNLSSEAQDRGLAFVDDFNFRISKDNVTPIANILRDVKGVYDEDETCRSNWIDELNRGYSVIHLASHSEPYRNTFSLINKEDFVNESDIAVYDVIERDDIKPNFNFLNLSACSACKYEELSTGAISNMGEMYLYKDTSLGLNVNGATYTCHGTAVEKDEQFYNNLMNKVPVGIAYKDSIIRKGGTNTLYSVLLGDPTIKYNLKKLDNATPYMKTALSPHLWYYGQEKYNLVLGGKDLEIEAFDNDGDEQIYFDFDNTLPDGVTIRQKNNFIYLNFPEEVNKEDEVYPITINIFNKDSNGEKINNYKELFYVQVVQPKEYKATSSVNDKNCTTAERNGLGFLINNKVEASKDNYITYNNVHIDEEGDYDIAINYAYGANQRGVFKIVGDDASEERVDFIGGKGTEKVEYVHLKEGDYSFNISASTDAGLPYMVSLIVNRRV